MSNLPSDQITINELKETLYAAVITLWRNVYMLQTADMVEVQHFESLRVKFESTSGNYVHYRNVLLNCMIINVYFLPVLTIQKHVKDSRHHKSFREILVLSP
jgi:hypothetical protein